MDLAWSQYYQRTITDLINRSVLDVCSDNLPIKGQPLEIDGIISISSPNDVSKQIVVKIHKLLSDRGVKKLDNTESSHNEGNKPWHIPLSKISSANNSRKLYSELDNRVNGEQNLRKSLDANDCNSVIQHAQNGALASTLRNVLMQQKENVSITQNNGEASKENRPENTVNGNAGTDDEDVACNKNPLSGSHPTNGEMLCKVCSVTCFGGFAGLQAHTFEVHRRFVCKHCCSTFSMRCNLRRHERLHQGLKPYPCDKCNKSFARSTDLKFHMEKHLQNGESVNCKTCEKSFNSSNLLQMHIHKEHPNEVEMYACTPCEKLFNSKADFEDHKVAHCRENAEDGVSQLESSMKKYLPSSGVEDLSKSSVENDNNNSLDLSALKVKQEIVEDLPPLTIDLGDNKSQDGKSVSSRHSSPEPSRKRRKGNPVKHVEVEESYDNDAYSLDLTASHNSDKSLDLSVSQNESDKPGLRKMPLLSSGSHGSTGSHGYPESLSHSINSNFSMAESDDCSAMDLSQSCDSTSYQYLLKNVADITGQRTEDWYEESRLSKSDGMLPLRLASMYMPMPKLSKSLSSSPSAKPLSLMKSWSPQGSRSFTAGLNNNYKLDTPSRLMTDDSGSNTSLNSSLSLSDTSFVDDDKEYQCSHPGCAVRFIGFKQYDNHYLQAHNRYPCKLCAQSFSGKNNRTRHLRSYHGKKAYACPECGKYFSRPDSLREHRFTHTSSYKQDRCMKCGSEYTKKSQLLSHLKNCFRAQPHGNGTTNIVDGLSPMGGSALSELHLDPTSKALLPPSNSSTPTVVDKPLPPLVAKGLPPLLLPKETVKEPASLSPDSVHDLALNSNVINITPSVNHASPRASPTMENLPPLVAKEGVQDLALKDNTVPVTPALNHVTA